LLLSSTPAQKKEKEENLGPASKSGLEQWRDVDNTLIPPSVVPVSPREEEEWAPAHQTGEDDRNDVPWAGTQEKEKPVARDNFCGPRKKARGQVKKLDYYHPPDDKE